MVVTTNPTAEVSAGDVSVASSPLGASILLDGVYYGTTPGNLTGISPGNHIMRLALSGYYDYEGTIYVVPGQVTHVFGTLPPLSGAVSQTLQPVTTAPTTVLPATTVQPTATQTSSAGALENPTVIAAIIGIITACIGAGATIFTHISKIKKE
ncbi:MAG: PEGA domain-containing protein [Methanoregula sp.]|nr:PEGA domain-containing protein [Methanoregula sp.]